MAQTPARTVVFNLIALSLFDRLHESFPAPLDVDPLELFGRVRAHVEPQVIDAALRDPARPRPMGDDELVHHAVDWLERERYLSIEGRHRDIVGVTLTEKAMTVLNGVPSAILQRREPLIDRIREAMIEEAPKVMLDKAASAITAVIAAGAAVIG